MYYKPVLAIFISILLLILLIGCGEQASIWGLGRSPLLKAVETADTTAVRALLAKGGNPNEADELGWTALMIASGKGYNEIIQLLLDKGAIVNYTTINGWTALMRAAETGQTNSVTMLLKYGANINAKNKTGMTSLMLAVENRKADTVKALITQRRIDLATRDNSGRTALAIATKKNDTEIIAILKHAGAWQ
jgi:ankyrin repeat protein